MPASFRREPTASVSSWGPEISQRRILFTKESAKSSYDWQRKSINLWLRKSAGKSDRGFFAALPIRINCNPSCRESSCRSQTAQQAREARNHHDGRWEENPGNDRCHAVFTAWHLLCLTHLEVTPGFEPGNEGFADPCLTTWLCHRGAVSEGHYTIPRGGCQGGRKIFLWIKFRRAAPGRDSPFSPFFTPWRGH